MKFIYDQFDKHRKHFEKGGNLSFLYPLFEAKETFLFTTPHQTHEGAHIRDAIDLKRLMSTVIIALLPCFIFGIYNVGYQYFMAQAQQPEFFACMTVGLYKVLPIVLVSYAVGGTWELVFALIRKHEINEGFLVTGLLVPLIVPPTIPLWQLACGLSFGVVIGKEIFGGTGMNIFNPALTARAFMFFAFPVQMSGNKAWSFLGDGIGFDNAVLVDAYSGATPLGVAAAVKTGTVFDALQNFGAGFTDYSWCHSFIGLIPGSIGETSTLAILLGAAYLIFTGVGSWRVMLAVILGGVGMSCVFNFMAPHFDNPLLELSFDYHMVLGGFMFGAVFMATDPVSASGTNAGKWIYGLFVGALAILIRVINPAYPEGMMLAILFCNMCAPLIDHYVVQAHMKKRLNRA